MRRILSLVAAGSLLLTASSAPARIGETEAQIEKRYGKAVFTFSHGSELPRKGYIASGFRITVTYIDGVSQAEDYHKPDEAKLSQTEIDTLLAANASGSTWTEQQTPVVLLRRWTLNSGGLYRCLC